MFPLQYCNLDLRNICIITSIFIATVKQIFISVLRKTVINVTCFRTYSGKENKARKIKWILHIRNVLFCKCSKEKKQNFMKIFDHNICISRLFTPTNGKVSYQRSINYKMPMNNNINQLFYM